MQPNKIQRRKSVISHKPMGCASSKLFSKDLKQDILFGNEDYNNHVVSLTSSTYGALILDNKDQPQQKCLVEPRKSVSRQEPEIINAWELMEDLEDGVPISVLARKSPKSRAFLRGFTDLNAKNPLKFFNQMGSPKSLKKFSGKENKGQVNGFGRMDYSPKTVLKARNISENSRKNSPNLRLPLKCDIKGMDLGGISSRRWRTLGPLFDPKLVASSEKELSEEGEHIKKIVSVTPSSPNVKNSRESESAIELFDKIRPPGGENTVVIYTTTLRGIRKTFEDCNTTRSIIESHHVQMFERDVSMDLGYKEELRGVMGTKQVKVPVVFVKGRLIGGADEIVKLEEEGTLGILFDQIPRAIIGCQGCSGVRFVICTECNGSCKVFNENGKKTDKCGECNENGLIQCLNCC